jgi:hypothetical protein
MSRHSYPCISITTAVWLSLPKRQMIFAKSMLPLAVVNISVPSSSGHVSTRLNAFPCYLQVVISVPSSSGHTFQRPRRRLVQHSLCEFQSPLHRGTRFNLISGLSIAAALADFSPLFIGAHVSTRGLVDEARADLYFSPSSSGHTFQPCGAYRH